MTIYTVGYSALGFESEVIIPKLRTLAKDYEAVIIDCRAKPYGLVNKKDLEQQLGHRYRWIAGFGNPAFKKYAHKSALPYKNIIFLCAESSHKKCHRLNVAEIQRNIRAKGEDIIHLHSTAKEKEQRWDSQQSLLMFM